MGVWIPEQVRSETGEADRHLKGFLNGGALVRAAAEGIDTGAGGAQTRRDPWVRRGRGGASTAGTVEA
jgi:hypothetical protein